MLTAVRCHNYRGFEDFTVDGLGRVNLVVGRNNSGKSSWIAAACCAGLGPLPLLAPLKRSTVDFLSDREGVWRPCFRDGDEGRGLSITVETAAGSQRMALRSVRTDRALIVGPESWWFDLELSGPVSGATSFLVRNGNIVQSQPLPSFAMATWTGAGVGLSAWDRTKLQALALEGALDRVSDPLRAFDPRIEAIELIGEAVVVRLAGVQRRLPFAMLGDGAFRILDVVLALAEDVAGPRGMDEIDASLHHASLPLLWRMLRAGPPQAQIFATTHRDESVRAAAEVFLEAGDEGLRVLRFDRVDGRPRAVSYTAAEVLDAIDAGWEVRG